MPASLDSAFINTIIGEGSSARGEFVVKGFFRIDGDFSGSIKTSGRILVGVTGRAKGELHGRDVVVGGVFRGDIYADEHVVLLASAVVLGNVYSPRLEIERGSILDGYACITPRIREEGPHAVHLQSSYVLKIDTTAKVASPLSQWEQ
ncbi:MAG: polymer-forming cytoskeletal protein [Spirochaetales bacterium]|nr:polymer-forming cytoskeletal protein [Spirochaetales bacterium]